MSSAASLAVPDSATGPARILTISPVATTSRTTLAEDSEDLFPVSLADRVEGRFLAKLA